MEQWTHTTLGELSPQQMHVAIIVAMGIGVLYCFLGYRVFKFLLALTGFILAGSFAGALVGFVTQGRLLFIVIAACLGGISGAFALLFFYKLGVFCLGVLGAALVAQSVLAGRPEDWVSSAILGSAVFGGLCALLIERPVMIFVTAALGAWVTVHGLAYFLLGAAAAEDFQQLFEDQQTAWIVVIAWAMLTCAGAVMQFATYKTKPQS